jgi:hypothetical protein
MPQWEYKIIDLGSARAEQGEIILNALGEQGWELVAINQPWPLRSLLLEDARRPDRPAVQADPQVTGEATSSTATYR